MGRFGGEDIRSWRGPDGRTTAGFRSVAERCWKESGYGPGQSQSQHGLLGVALLNEEKSQINRRN